jgi:CIC family chloride channel protein
MPGAAALPSRFLGGAALASEILYPHEAKVEAVVAALIAATVGYTVYGAYIGFTPIFGN